MKKTRMISLLLSVIMAASSLPVMASAADTNDAPTKYNTELLTNNYLDKSNWGGDLGVTSVDVDNTNKLLRMDERKVHSSYVKLTLNGANLKYDAETDANNNYTVTLRLRVQDLATSRLMQVRAHNSSVWENTHSIVNKFADYDFKTKLTADMNNLEIQLRGGNNLAWSRPVEIDYAVLKDAIGQEIKTWNFNEDAYITPEWKWETQNANVNGSWVEEKDYIRVGSTTQHENVKNLDISDTEAVETHYKKSVSYNAGNIPLTPGKYELTFDARQSWFYHLSEHNSAEYEYEYKIQLGDETDKAEVVPTKGKRTYEYIGSNKNLCLERINPDTNKGEQITITDADDQYKLHHIIYHQDTNVYNANYRDVAVALKDSNGGTIETDIDTVTVDTAWDSYKLTFTVPAGKEYTLSSINFGGTGYAYDNDEFDISCLSLKLVEPIFEKTATPIATDILANETPVDSTSVPAVYDGYDKNGFISAYRLGWNYGNGPWNCDSIMFNLKFNEACDKDCTYLVKFDVRHSVPASDKQYILAELYDSKTKSTLLHKYSENGENWVGYDGVGIPLASTGSMWETMTFAINGGNFTDDTTDDFTSNVWVRIRRNYGKINNTNDARDIPVDFDNLVVWKEYAGGDGVFTSDDVPNILYNEDFNGTNEDYSSVTATNVHHNFEWEYAAAPELAYTGLEDREDVGEGIYTFKADVRVPYFYYYNMRLNGATELGTDDNAKNTFLAYNMHDAKVTFTMTNGTDTKEKSVTYEKVLNPMWSTIEASVVVDEGYKISSVKVTPTFNSTFAANVADANEVIDFKNVSLKNTADIKEGISDDNKENFLDKATEHRINASYEEIDGTGADGYITADNRDWFFFTDDSEWQSRNPIVALTLDEEYDPTATYHVSFKLRHHVSANDKQTVQVRLMGERLNGATVPIENADGWNGYDLTLNPGAYTGKVKLLIRRGNDVTDIPVDIDDLKILKTTSSGTEELYNKDFNKADEIYIGTSEDVELLYNEQNLRLTHNFDDTFRRVTADQTANPVTEPEVAYIKLNGGEGHGEGIYTFRADLRVPYYLYTDIRQEGEDNSWTESSTDEVQTYRNYNKHEVNVTFTMTDGTKTTYSTVKGEIGPTWSTIQSPVIVKEGYKLTDIKITPTVGFPEEVSTLKYVLDYKNVSLSWADYPEVSVEDNENYLDGVTVYVDNALPTEIIETAPEGYIYVGQRMPGIENYDASGADKNLVDNATKEFLILDLDCKLSKGTTYYISYDIKSEGEMQLRVKVKPSTDGAKDDSCNGYIKSIEGSDFNDSVSGSYVISEILSGNKEYTYLGKFTPAASSDNLVITFDRGTSNWRFNSPITIDNLKVWRGEGENKVYVYENDFNSEGGINSIIGNTYQSSGNPDTEYAVEHVLPVSHSLYTPIDSTKTMTLTYDLNLTNDEAVEGKYSFKTMVKLSEATDKAARARVIFNYSDGTSDVNYIDITDDWGYIGKSGWLERYPDLESITIEFDSDVPVMLIKPELTIFYKYTYGKPNTGIVMVLIKKMQGKMVDPWKQAGFN